MLSQSNVHSLLNVIYEQYGYDFRDYSEAHIHRRITNRLTLSSIKTFDNLQDRVRNDSEFASLLLQDLSITVTEMFRDPDFYKAVREVVVPLLKTYSYIKIWHAGCSTGEEAYSMAILLKEEGLYDRSILYATDFNQSALNQAREGIFPARVIRQYTANYQKSGAKDSFSNYYRASYDQVIFDQELKKNIVWANHNLVTDSVFSEVHLVVCRNVLIYFKSMLQNKVLGLFYDSLVNGGILCLGTKESLQFSTFSKKYSELDGRFKIFRKKYVPV